MANVELEQRLRDLYESEIGSTETAPPSLQHRVDAVPWSAPVPASRGWQRVVLLAAAAMLVAAMGGAVAIGSGVVKLPTVVPVLLSPSPSVDEGPIEWTGPVREQNGEIAIVPMSSADGGEAYTASDAVGDARTSWVDIDRVTLNQLSQPGWHIGLVDPPPPSGGLGPSEILAYGFVFETSGDDIADIMIGIDNDVPNPGDLHVWVTYLAPGTTIEQVGGPYGYPVEFSYPGEASTEELPPEVFFTFLRGSRPQSLDIETTRFYAWASRTVDGEVVAWDYAPDNAWLSLSEVTEATSTASGEPSPSASDEPEAAPALPWMSGRELMDTLSTEYGYEWQEYVIGEGVGADTKAYSRSSPASEDGEPPSADWADIRFYGPLNEPADVQVAVAADVARREGAAQVELARVIQLIAPDTSEWVAGALASGLACLDRGMTHANALEGYPSSRAFFAETTTSTGGHVGVLVLDEEQLTDWVAVMYDEHGGFVYEPNDC